MNLHFERGNRDAPLGHALIYFNADGDAIVAMAVIASPIKFDLSSYVPEIFAGAMKGLDLSNKAVALPPVPEEVPGLDYLRELAARRQDDLVYAGAVTRADPMRLMAEAAEATQAYADLYSSTLEAPADAVPASMPQLDSPTFAGLSEREQLDELNQLTGRLVVSLSNGEADPEVKQQMQELASVLPPKYRVRELIVALQQPGDRSRKLAELYMERCYKLFNEDYLDLERIDREIEAAYG